MSVGGGSSGGGGGAAQLARFSMVSQSSARTSILSTSSSEMHYLDSRDSVMTSPDSVFSQNTPKRQKVAEEILDTERRYFDCLVILIDVQIVSRRTINDIFSNIRGIYGVNHELLNELRSRIETVPFDASRTLIGNVFLTLTPYLKMYSLYTTNFNRALALVTEIAQKNQAFAAFTREQARRPECKGRILQTFLIEPVQRIPRYKLLLEDLVKHTPENHPDYGDLNKALKRISEVATFVNEEIRKHENVLQIIEIQKNLLNLHESKSPVTPLLEDQVMFHRKLLLDQCRIEDVPDTDVVKNRFLIVTREKSFAVYSDTPEAKQKWLEQLRSTIDEWIASRETFRIAASGSASSCEAAPYVAPVWVPDSLADHCHLCTTEFTLFNRKSFYVPINGRERLERCCDACFQDIVREQRFRVHIAAAPQSVVAGTQVAAGSVSSTKHLAHEHVVTDPDNEPSSPTKRIAGQPGTLASAAQPASAAMALWSHRTDSMRCSLCREPYTYLRMMCDPCSRGIRPDEIVINPSGGWSYRFPEGP
ncbi:hypothetical protein HK105_201879 [Polyrhizophydium stewartii]|uniref:Rho guanine nucleotide exchange factor n=1 Tax=Polyrhizophydium stewartii TaxID=2732419 RepID=A0ABR4NG18_9FUNG